MNHARNWSRVIEQALYICSLVTFVIIFQMCLKGPIFVDEIHWLLQNAHAHEDGLAVVNLYPDCESNFTWAIPVLLLPNKILASLLHPTSLWGVRLYGASKYLLCIGEFSLILCAASAGELTWLASIAVSASLLSLGFLPSLLMLNRPETNLLIGISSLIILVLTSAKAPGPARRHLTVIAFLFLLSFLLCQHPKVQSFMPALIVLAISFANTLFTTSPAKRIAFLATVGLLLISGIDLWKNHQECPSSLNAQKSLQFHTLLPQDVINDPRKSIHEAVSNLVNIANKYMPPLTVADSYQGYKLNKYGHHDPSLLRDAANLLLHLCPFLLLLLLFAGMVLSLERRVKQDIAAHPALPASFPFLLLLPVLFTFVTKKTWGSFWEAGYLFYLACLAAVLLARQLKWYRNFPRVLCMLTLFIACTGIVSHAALYEGWHTFYDDASSTSKYQNGYLNSPNYVLNQNYQGIFDEPKRDQRIQQTAAMCKLSLDQKSSHLLFDNWTYMAVRKTYQPFYGEHLILAPPNSESLIDFLKRKKSSGALTLCQTLPPALRALAKENQGICCIPRFGN